MFSNLNISRFFCKNGLFLFGQTQPKAKIKLKCIAHFKRIQTRKCLSHSLSLRTLYEQGKKTISFLENIHHDINHMFHRVAKQPSYSCALSSFVLLLTNKHSPSLIQKHTLAYLACPFPKIDTTIG